MTRINREIRAWQNNFRNSCRIIIHKSSAACILMRLASRVIPAPFSRYDVNDNDALHRCMLFHFDQKLQYLTTRGPLAHFTTAAGYLPAGESILLSLSALCTSAPRVRSSPALTCLPLTFLALRGQRSTFVAFKRCDSRRAVHSSFHVAAQTPLGHGRVEKKRKGEGKKERQSLYLSLPTFDPLCFVLHTSHTRRPMSFFCISPRIRNQSSHLGE